MPAVRLPTMRPPVSVPGRVAPAVHTTPQPAAPTRPAATQAGAGAGAAPTNPISQAGQVKSTFGSGLGSALGGVGSSIVATTAATVGGGWLLNAFTGKDTTGLGAIGSGIGEAFGGVGDAVGAVGAGVGSGLSILPYAAAAGAALFLIMNMRK